jgi:hypothetical protein
MYAQVRNHTEETTINPECGTSIGKLNPLCKSVPSESRAGNLSRSTKASSHSGRKSRSLIADGAHRGPRAQHASSAAAGPARPSPACAGLGPASRARRGGRRRRTASAFRQSRPSPRSVRACRSRGCGEAAAGRGRGAPSRAEPSRAEPSRAVRMADPQLFCVAEERSGHCAVVDGNFLYVWGGYVVRGRGGAAMGTRAEGTPAPAHARSRPRPQWGASGPGPARPASRAPLRRRPRSRARLHCRRPAEAPAPKAFQPISRHSCPPPPPGGPVTSQVCETVTAPLVILRY